MRKKLSRETLTALRESDLRHARELRRADQQALQAAFEAAKEKSASHNDLIHAMERQQASFITKGMLYAALFAAIGVLTLVVTYYANFGQ